MSFDSHKFFLGTICKRGHDYQGSGKSLRRWGNSGCVECERVRRNALIPQPLLPGEKGSRKEGSRKEGSQEECEKKFLPSPALEEGLGVRADRDLQQRGEAPIAPVKPDPPALIKAAVPRLTIDRAPSALPDRIAPAIPASSCREAEIDWLRVLVSGVGGAVVGFAVILSTGFMVAQTPVPSPTPEPVAIDAPRKFKIQVALSSPADLKVREGDSVRVGQILSDRARERERIQAQQAQLEIQQERLRQPTAPVPPVKPVPGIANLPAPSFLEQIAEINRHQLQVQQAQQTLDLQQRKIDLLQTYPAGELPQATIPHEQKVLERLQGELQQQQAELQLTQARLAKAQKDRAYEEYLHSLELSKRQLSINQQDLERQRQVQARDQQERDRAFQLAQLQSQLQALDTQLLSLSAVRSPYAGKIQKIKWLGQRDTSLTVELSLVLGKSGDRPGEAAPDSDRERDGGGRVSGTGAGTGSRGAAN